MDGTAADLFVSYSRSDLGRVKQIVDALQELKLSVWHDASLQAGETFDSEIHRQLKGAKAVLVAWSNTSIDSRWVRGEALVGSERDILIPIFLERCRPPPPFNVYHTLDLSSWNGERKDKEWQKLVERIALLAAPQIMDGADCPTLTRAPPGVAVTLPDVDAPATDLTSEQEPNAPAPTVQIENAVTTSEPQLEGWRPPGWAIALGATSALLVGAWALSPKQPQPISSTQEVQQLPKQEAAPAVEQSSNTKRSRETKAAIRPNVSGGPATAAKVEVEAQEVARAASAPALPNSGRSNSESTAMTPQQRSEAERAMWQQFLTTRAQAASAPTLDDRVPIIDQKVYPSVR